jgi:DNA-binding response OmpR family regulator
LDFQPLSKFLANLLREISTRQVQVAIRRAFPYVLALDHDTDTREMYAFALVRSAFRVTIAATVADALERTRILKPDVITADLHGGPRDCCELTEGLKASAETGRSPSLP